MLKKIVVLILLSTLLTSCLPGWITGMDREQRKELRHKKKCQRKFDRIVKQCPEYFVLDSVEVPLPISTDSQRVERDFQIDSPSDSLKAILRHYQLLSDSLIGGNDSLMSVVLNSLGSEIIRYVDRYKFLSDTISIDTAILININGKTLEVRVVIGAHQKTARSITPFVYVPENNYDMPFNCPDEKLVRPKLTIQEQIFEWLKVNYMWALIIIGIILIVTYIKKSWFP